MEPRPKNDLSRRKWLSAYAKFSSLVFQMMAIILGGTWLGYKIDGWLSTTGPWFTTTGALLSLAASFYLLIKAIPKK